MTIILPVLIGLAGYRSLTKGHRAITCLLAIGLVNELLMIAVALLKMSNLFTMHLYALVEIILLSIYFYHQVESGRVRKFIIGGMTALSAFAIVYALNGNNIAEFNSIPRAIECLYFCLLCIWLFYEMAINEGDLDRSLYLVNGAIMFYFSSCFMVFAFSKYLAADNEGLVLMFTIHSVVNAICNITYAAGLWISSRYSYSRA